MWIFWPSFNAILADNDAYHRAIINTYISLLGQLLFYSFSDAKLVVNQSTTNLLIYCTQRFHHFHIYIFNSFGKVSTQITFRSSNFPHLIHLTSGRRLDMVDIQNATLSGGVAVGAIADLMVQSTLSMISSTVNFFLKIQPYGAFLAGTLTGIVSCLGYRLAQPFLFRKIGLHDTCGVSTTITLKFK